MSDKDTQEATQPLGTFLREQREQRGVSLAEVAETTKISLPILKAMEEDEYERMPADAFCRGFYSIYANFLELDPKKILLQYTAGRGIEPTLSKNAIMPPVKDSQKFTNYAEPSSISPATSMTCFVAVCLLLIFGACWYFNFNPLDYVSNQLLPPQTIIEESDQSATVVQPAIEPVETQAVTDIDAPQTVADTPASDKALQPEEALPLETLPATNDKTSIDLPTATEDPPSAITLYHLEIHFNNSGILKVTLDDGFVLDKRFRAGETLQWEVQKKIILDMPEALSGTLSLNGIEIPLPVAENGRRLLSLPEDLLD